MKKLQNFQALMFRPRYLRAIPSLVVLTTAMAWSVMPDTDSDVMDSVQKKSSVAVSQTHVLQLAVNAPLLMLPAPGNDEA